MNSLNKKLPLSPIIHSNEILQTKNLGLMETEEGELHLILLIMKDGRKFLVAGGVCNTGLMGIYTYELDEFTTTRDALTEFLSDIEAYESGGIPSRDLMEFNGSLVI